MNEFWDCLEPLAETCTDIREGVECTCSGRCVGQCCASGVAGIWTGVRETASCVHATVTGLAGFIWSLLVLTMLGALVYLWYTYGDSTSFVKDFYGRAKWVAG